MPVEMRSLGDGVLQAERGDRQHREAGVADEEGVFVRSVQRAAVLEDPQAPRRGLLGDPVVEHDHAVRHVLLDAVAGQRTVAAFAGDDGGDPAILQPGEEPAKLRAHRGGIGERAEQILQGVEHDAFGVHLIDGGTEPDEERLEIPLAGLVHVDPARLRCGRERASRRA